MKKVLIIDDAADGRQVIGKVPEKAGYAVVGSGETSTPNRDAIFEAGCERFVNKPVDYDLLIKRVAEAIG